MLEGPFKNSPSSSPCAKWNCYGPLSSSLWTTTFSLSLSSISDSRVNNSRTDVCVLGTHTRVLSYSRTTVIEGEGRKRLESHYSRTADAVPLLLSQKGTVQVEGENIFPFHYFSLSIHECLSLTLALLVFFLHVVPMVLDVCCLSEKCEGRARKTHWRVKSFSNFSRWKK